MLSWDEMGRTVTHENLQNKLWIRLEDYRS